MDTLHIVGATGQIGKRLVERGPSLLNASTTINPISRFELKLDKTPLHFDFSKALTVNVITTGDFIHEALSRGCKVIFLSSDAVYGDVNGEFDEEQPIKPLGVYAETKSIIEKRFVEYPLFKLLRLSFNFFKDDRFTTYLRNCVKEGSVAEIFDPFVRSIVHRDDTVDAIISLTNKWDVCEETIINCGGPETLSRIEFADIIKMVLPNLQTKVITPEEKFYQDRPAVVSMRGSSYGVFKWILKIINPGQKLNL
jgi:dTDP-4-dehydrorhamnose reductase